MKIEMTPAEAMAVYDVLNYVTIAKTDDEGESHLLDVVADSLFNVRNQLRSAIIDNVANIDAFEKWYAAQQEKVTALDAQRVEQCVDNMKTMKQEANVKYSDKGV